MIEKLFIVFLCIISFVVCSFEEKKLEVDFSFLDDGNYRFVGEKDWSNIYGKSPYNHSFQKIFNNTPKSIQSKHDDAHLWVGYIYQGATYSTIVGLVWNLTFIFIDQKKLIDWNIIGGILIADYIFYEIAKGKLHDTVDSYNKWVEEKNKNISLLPSIYPYSDKTVLAWNYWF